jgi:hypothetical protein
VETWYAFWLSLGWVVSKWVALGCGSITVRLHDVIDVVIFMEMSSLPVY